ncbi:porin [Pseudomonadota bacterium]
MGSWCYFPNRHNTSRCLVLLTVLVCHTAMASGQQSTTDNSRVLNAISGLAGDDSFIDSLLIDREFPVIGGRWGSEIFIDAPLNAEPDGAEVTLRRAKLKYLRNFGNDWRLKLTADYNSGGDLELSDNYVTYSGWKRRLLTLGISDPAFSLESVSQSAALTFMERV